MKISVLIHNIRSMHNIGAIFRTSDGAGVDHIYLSGYSALPPRKEIAKVSLGAEDFVPWSTIEDPLLLIEQLQKQNTEVVLLEQVEGSINYSDWHNKTVPQNEAPQSSTPQKSTPQSSAANAKADKDILLVLGSELEGADQSLIDAADTYLELPMRGHKKSLNVSVAYGIAIYELTKNK